LPFTVTFLGSGVRMYTATKKNMCFKEIGLLLHAQNMAHDQGLIVNIISRDGNDDLIKHKIFA